MLALKRDCVVLAETSANGFWGTVQIRRGLKRDARKRDIPITQDMAVALHKLLATSRCDHIFSSLKNPSRPLSANTLANQHRQMMRTGEFAPDSGLHALRHTFLTEAGRHTQNVRALQLLAGHSNIATTMRYIHPDAADVMEIAHHVQQARTGRILRDAPEVPTKLPTVN